MLDTTPTASQQVRLLMAAAVLANDGATPTGTSLFTEYLVTGLLGEAEDRNGDGYVDLREIYDYVRNRLATTTEQVPHSRFDGDAEVTLARRRSAPALSKVSRSPHRADPAFALSENVIIAIAPLLASWIIVGAIFAVVAFKFAGKAEGDKDPSGRPFGLDLIYTARVLSIVAILLQAGCTAAPPAATAARSRPTSPSFSSPAGSTRSSPPPSPATSPPPSGCPGAPTTTLAPSSKTACSANGSCSPTATTGPSPTWSPPTDPNPRRVPATEDPQVVSFSPMHHWTDQKIRVHVFTCVLALAVAHLMRRTATQAGLHLSVRELLDHLEGIGETVLLHHDGGKGPTPRPTPAHRHERQLDWMMIAPGGFSRAHSSAAGWLTLVMSTQPPVRSRG
jgi:hypothetical protein